VHTTGAPHRAMQSAVQTAQLPAPEVGQKVRTLATVMPYSHGVAATIATQDVQAMQAKKLRVVSSQTMPKMTESGLGCNGDHMGNTRRLTVPVAKSKFHS
jgi:hypothetical protein